MPSGSIAGQKRGGRKAGTPNSATAIRRQLAEAVEYRLAQSLGVLPRDATLPERLKRAADVHQAVAADAQAGAMPMADAVTHADRKPFAGDAVDLMQQVYRDPRYPMVMRIDVAKACARYERPMLAATTITADPDSLAAWRQADTRQAIESQVVSVLARHGIVTAPVVHDVIDATDSLPDAGKDTTK